MNKFLLFIFLVFASFPVSAQEEVKYDCAANKDQIIHDLAQPVECFHDDECNFYNFGYPWQPDLCMKAIINKKKESHNMTNMRIIEEYNENCINNDPAEKKKYDDFQQKIANDDCVDVPRTYCYKGFCRIVNYSLYNDK